MHIFIFPLTNLGNKVHIIQGKIWYLFYCTSQILCFSQTEGKIFHQEKCYDSLYCNTRLIDCGLEPNLQYACTHLTMQRKTCIALRSKTTYEEY